MSQQTCNHLTHYKMNKPAILLLLFTFAQTLLAHTLEDSENLQSQLMNGYNKHVRPMQDQRAAIYVNISFYISYIKEFDEVKGKLSIAGGLEMRWYDYRLSWDAAAYNNCYYTQLPSDWVWKPSIHLENSADSIETINPAWVHVSYVFNGMAIWNTRDTFEVACTVNIEYYPFDTQYCIILVFPDVYGSQELQFVAVSDKVEKTYYFENGEWELVDTNATIVDAGISYFVATLVMKRRPWFVVVNVILPMFVIGILNLFVFALPSDSGERISYAVTLLLAIAVFLTIISDSIPRTSAPMSILSYCIGAQVILSSLILLAVIFSLHLFHKDDDAPVPSWIACFCTKARYPGRNGITKKRDRDHAPHEIHDRQMRIYSMNAGSKTGEIRNIDKSPNGRLKDDHHLQDIDSIEDKKITWKQVSFAFDKIMFVISFICYVTCYVVYIVLVNQ